MAPTRGEADASARRPDGEAEERPGGDGPGDDDRAFNLFGMVGSMVAFGGLAIGVLWAVSHLVGGLSESKQFKPEVSLPLLLLAGAVLLMLSVAMVAIQFGRMKLVSDRYPLGLPEGSIRAIIALLLILLFFITAVFLYSTTTNRSAARTLRGVTAAQLATIAPGDIVGQSVVSGEGDTAIYDVIVATEPSEDSVDMAKQLLTTVSTLVISISAFYFGARSVESAAAAQAPRRGPDNAPTGTVVPGPAPESAVPEPATPQADVPTPPPDPGPGPDEGEPADPDDPAAFDLPANTDNTPRPEDGEQLPQLEE